MMRTMMIMTKMSPEQEAEFTRRRGGSWRGTFWHKPITSVRFITRRLSGSDFNVVKCAAQLNWLTFSTWPSNPLFLFRFGVEKEKRQSPWTKTRHFVLHMTFLTKCFCSHAVLAAGTKGVPQTGLGFRLNIGKLESRMLCRRLERDGLIKVNPKFIQRVCARLKM